MVRNQIVDLLEKFEENRRKHCIVVDLYNTYSLLSSKITSFNERKKKMSESHRNLVKLLNNPKESLRCFLDEECPVCTKVNMDWEIGTTADNSVLVAKTSGRMNLTKNVCFHQGYNNQCR